MNITDRNIEELFKKFPDEMREMIRDNALAKNIFMLLLHGESPYHSIVRLLKVNQEQYKVLEDVVNRSAPSSIIIDKEIFESLKR